MRAARKGRDRIQAGFGVTGLAVIVVLMGLLLLPLLRLLTVSEGAARVQETQAALETARDALIAFAAANGGCLPFATDFEGGLPDTGLTGVGGYDDSGARINSNHAGDLPWADLGLTNSFLDGDNLRIQYYVATQYTDNNGTPSDGIECRARFFGFEWDLSVPYFGDSSKSLYVYYNVATNDRRLYRIKDTLPAGTPPNTVGPSIADELNFPLPASLLAVRRGPDVTAASPQNDPISSQNVFVLIAPGDNRNADLGRSYVRDSTHVDDGTGAVWTIQNITNDLNDNIFSMTPNIDATGAGNDGDDTVLVMSFNNYKASLSKYGFNMEPMCDANCP